MHTPTSPDTPLAQFFQLVPDGLPPRRADKSVGGGIPARALRYCEAITSASAFGWYVFLPMNFKVVWDGHDMLWTYPGVDEWLPLTRDAVQYPGFREHFDRHAPADVRGFSPPFLSPSIQPGQLQIWTGCVAKTAPGWSLLVRGVANLSKSPSYQMLEGIIETDTWFGPLFDNVRLLKTDVPIEFRADVPNKSRLAAFGGQHSAQKQQIPRLHSLHIGAEWLRGCWELDAKFPQPLFGAGGPTAFADYHLPTCEPPSTCSTSPAT